MAKILLYPLTVRLLSAFPQNSCYKETRDLTRGQAPCEVGAQTKESLSADGSDSYFVLHLMIDIMNSLCCEAQGGFFSVFQESANSPEVISITPNRNKNSPKVIFVTLGVFCFLPNVKMSLTS